MIEALIADVAVSLISLVGVFFFGDHRRLVGAQRYVIPMAVGVFLSLVFIELIPETLVMSPEYGAFAVAVGFVSFYILASYLHKKYHHLEAEDCDRKGAAMLLLIGDAVHNVADGVVLGGAFLIDPTVGVATAIGLAAHEVPQEVIEFGVLIRAGYSRRRAALYNLLSASSIMLGILLIMVVSTHTEGYVWILTGIAAGNLLFLAASDLLPRIHGNLKNYGSIWHSATSIIIGFIFMSAVLTWTHKEFGIEGAHDHHEQQHTH